MKHNEYPMLSQFINNNQSQFCHIIELKRTDIALKIRIVWTKCENIKLINGEASSSSLVEELASHDKWNHKETEILHWNWQTYKRIGVQSFKNPKK